jgi:uracil-DNA glycosylase
MTSAPLLDRQAALAEHVAALAGCRLCPLMIGPPVPPPPVLSPIYLVGQAPGPHEAGIGRPFAWTAGRTLFKWFSTLGVDEPTFRANVYMAAVCRCFPGKASSGGDRVPSPAEIGNCGRWMARERELLDTRLVLPIGRLAISRFLGNAPLVDVIGKVFPQDGYDVIPLPHPSGVSTWFKKEPGMSLTVEALDRIGAHPAWVETFSSPMTSAR